MRHGQLSEEKLQLLRPPNDHPVPAGPPRADRCLLARGRPLDPETETLQITGIV